MIGNVENEAYTAVKTAVVASFATAFVTGTYNPTPPKFPCVSIVMIDNSVYTATASSSSRENHARVTFEVNVYSNHVNRGKTQALEITRIISDAFLEMGFVRTLSQPIDNLQDNKIYRQLSRYSAIVDANNFTYSI